MIQNQLQVLNLYIVLEILMLIGFWVILIIKTYLKWKIIKIVIILVVKNVNILRIWMIYKENTKMQIKMICKRFLCGMVYEKQRT